MPSEPERSVLLRAEGVTKTFPVYRGIFRKAAEKVHAVDNVDLEVAARECVSLVGESGCGKTTLGRVLLRLLEPDSGTLTFFRGEDGEPVSVFDLPETGMQQLRRDMQIVFQDPLASLNPRQRTEEIVGEALSVHGLAHGQEKKDRVATLLEMVGLEPSFMSRYPHQYSGGQRQRVGIARALALEPRFMVLDEATSALDVSVQAQIINLLTELQKDLGLSYLFISHDLGVVRNVSHRVLVMYLGEIVESGPVGRIFETPQHPYTRALLSAVPSPTPGKSSKRIFLSGDVPSPSKPPPGCRFHTRCPEVMDICRREIPPVRSVDGGGFSRCHLDA